MRYVAVTSPDINNGLGCRVTLWISGCKHNCEGCHNAWVQDYNRGKELKYSKDKIYNELSNSYIKGLTISGGDPLYQDVDSLKELLEFIKDIKQDFKDKDIWLYTGFKYEDILKDINKVNIINLCDYIVEGRFELDKRDITLAFRGSPNQRIYHKVNNKFKQISNPENYFRNL